MSKIIEMYGTRSDGVKIHFTENDLTGLEFEKFTSVSVREEMTQQEVINKFGYNPLHTKQ